MSSQLDHDFYLKAYKDINIAIFNPLQHYMMIGRSENRLLSANHFNQLYPDFDPDFYRSYYADLQQFSLEELMSHYHHYGRFENRVCKKTIPFDPSLTYNKSGLTNSNDVYITPQRGGPSDPFWTQNQTMGSASVKNKTVYQSDNSSPTRYLNLENYRKIEQYKDISAYTVQCDLDPILKDLLNKMKRNIPIYLILGKWGYPPYGGGECWLIDTAKWMCNLGYDCYYIYFNDPVENHNFSKIEIINKDSCCFIRFPPNSIQLLKFIKLMNPMLISHQGHDRLHFLKIANLLGKPFLTGFCFWDDIIKVTQDSSKPESPYNRNMLDQNLIPNPNFNIICQDSTTCYVASQFVNDIIKKVHHPESPLPIIHTISDSKHYEFKKQRNNVYVTVVNICPLKGGKILERIINQTSLDIPFLLIDSQDSHTSTNQQFKLLLMQRNESEQKTKSCYRLSCDNMSQIYQQTKILLIPTLVDETFCRVAYEGMMNELPILSTDHGNLKYLLSGYADFLDEDPYNWSTKINQLYFDETKLSEMSRRPKTIDPNQVKSAFIDLVNQTLITKIPPHSKINHVGIVCPWADQGLGIQAREYYHVLESCGYQVSIYSYQPYHATKSDPKLQVDPSEWNYPNIYYGTQNREHIEIDDFLNYLYQYKVGKLIILETCHDKVFELARICKMLEIPVIAIPNLETMRYSEIYRHDLFDKILCNNQMTYDILSKFHPSKCMLFGFRILNKNFSFQKSWLPQPTFFCSGGLNSNSRKNVDKIIRAFKELENAKKLKNFQLFVYVQGVETPKTDSLNDTEHIKYSIKQRSYREIAELYKKHDIFIHMGDHEGLGLGFYESIVCGTPVLTIDTPPNNEIIHEGINGWLIKCNYEKLNDNPMGITLKASISVDDIKNKVLEIIDKYNREQIYQSTIRDYVTRYPNGLYFDQIKKIF
ncbi:MAG: glycosyltransferase [candidate division WOR-3 bacterium]